MDNISIHLLLRLILLLEQKNHREILLVEVHNMNHQEKDTIGMIIFLVIITVLTITIIIKKKLKH